MNRLLKVFILLCLSSIAFSQVSNISRLRALKNNVDIGAITAINFKTAPTTIPVVNASAIAGAIDVSYTVDPAGLGLGTMAYADSNLWLTKIAAAGKSSAGSAVSYFLDDSAHTIATFNYLFTYPITRMQQVDSAIVKSNDPALDTVLVEKYATVVGGLGGTTIDAGEWTFETFAGTSSSTGTNEVKIDMYSRTSGGTETFLFSVTTGDITGSTITQYTTNTVQPAFTINSTDILVARYYVLTVSNTTSHFIYFAHNGTSNYSHIVTPIVYRHNDLAGLQNSSAGTSYYHTPIPVGTGAYADSTKKDSIAVRKIKLGVVGSVVDSAKVRTDSLTIYVGGVGYSAYKNPPVSSGSGLPSLSVEFTDSCHIGMYVNLYLSGGVIKARKANATDNTKPAHGFVKATVNTGETGTVSSLSDANVAIDTAGIGALTIGTVYYLSTTAGKVTATPPATSGNIVQQLGIAVTIRELWAIIASIIEVG